MDLHTHTQLKVQSSTFIRLPVRDRYMYNLTQDAHKTHVHTIDTHNQLVLLAKKFVSIPAVSLMKPPRKRSQHRVYSPRVPNTANLSPWLKPFR